MTRLLRRAVVMMIFASSMMMALTGCGKKLVGNTFVAGNGQTRVEFTSDKKADFRKGGQDVFDIDWSQSGDTVTLKTRIFGDVQLKVQSDGSLMYGNIPLKQKE